MTYLTSAGGWRPWPGYSATAFEAMIMPICQAVGERAPIRSAWQPSQPRGTDADPLTAKVWPPG